jgi:hypothetical protein
MKTSLTSQSGRQNQPPVERTGLRFIINPGQPAARIEPSHEEIAAVAYSLYERDGFPQGRDVEHWIQAEIFLKEASVSSRGTASPAR